MLVVKYFLNGDKIGLKEIVRARTEENNLDKFAKLELH